MKKLFIDIHNALHDPEQKFVKINNVSVEITNDTNGMRNVIFKDEDNKEWEIIQQNPKTQSTFAKRARDGERISWLIPYYYGFRKQDGWKVITDSTPSI